MFNFFKPKDWVQIWSTSGTWVDHTNDTIGRVHYMIDYSESRNMYRLRKQGHKPSEHGLYGEALSALSKFNLELINDPQRVRDNKLKKLGI